MSASEVEWTRPTAEIRIVETTSLVPEVWEGPGNDGFTLEEEGERFPGIVVTGSLEAVDLRIDHFRIIDDVSNRIPLDGVRNAETVAHLIGQRVRAEGTAIVDRGRLRGLQEVTIEPQALPSAWFSKQHFDIGAELAKPGPRYGHGADLIDEEFADFMSAIKG